MIIVMQPDADDAAIAAVDFLEHGVDVIQIGTRNRQNFDLLK